MVLYHAANAACFVKCLLHKCIFHPNEDAVFVGYAHLSKSFFVPEKYRCYMEYTPLIGPFGDGNQKNKKEIIKEIVDLFDRLFKKNGININDCTDVYIGSYYAEFAMYVNIKKIQHSIFEEAAGDWKPLEWSGYETFNSIIRDLDMREYNNELVKYRYGVFKVWPSQYRSDKDINYEPYKEIYKLNLKDKQYFIDKFKIPQLVFNNAGNTLILTQWFFKNGKKWRDREVINMYGIIADYFIENAHYNTVYLKPHPADPLQEEYTSLEKINIISPKCISELMGLIDGINFDLAVTVSSSSLFTIGEFTKETKQIGDNIVTSYCRIHKYYFAFVDLVSYLQYSQIYRFGVMDGEYELLKGIPEVKQNMLLKDVRWKNWERVGESVVIVQRMRWKENQEKIVIDRNKFDEDTICIFLDIDELIKHGSGDLDYIIDNSVVYKMNKVNVKTNLVEAKPEFVYCFCKNPQIRNMLYMYSSTKYLKYEGCILCVKPLKETEEEFVRLKLKDKIQNN